MPVVRFDVMWPDATVMRCQSPSTIIRSFFTEGEALPLAQFMASAERGLNAASERVREKYGFACSAASDQLEIIQRKAEEFKQSSDAVVQVIKVY